MWATPTYGAWLSQKALVLLAPSSEEPKVRRGVIFGLRIKYYVGKRKKRGTILKQNAKRQKELCTYKLLAEAKQGVSCMRNETRSIFHLPPPSAVALMGMRLQKIVKMVAVVSYVSNRLVQETCSATAATRNVAQLRAQQ